MLWGTCLGGVKAGAPRKNPFTKFCTALCKLRLSSHCLEIEVGLWAKLNKPPLDKRKRCICNFIFSWNVN